MIWKKWFEKAICRQDCIWLTQRERERKKGYRKEKERRMKGKSKRREEEGRKKEISYCFHESTYYMKNIKG